MLQQTQVDRVIPYFTAWMRRYPTIRTLAQAPLSDVLRSWQGLGYNRRAKMLHAAAQAVVQKYKGKLPSSQAQLQELPGIGPYTAAAIAAFAHNQDVVFVETNLRTVVIHHFFVDRTDVRDSEIAAVLAQALPKGRAREWYAALMDYGAHLKRSGVRTNAKAKGYTKQSPFTGSAREARGVIVRALAKGARSGQSLLQILGRERIEQVQAQLQALEREGFIQKHARSYRLTP